MSPDPPRFHLLQMQLRLLLWLCRDPARYTAFIATTPRARFEAELMALLLPKTVFPEVLFVEQKFSVGVTRMLKYTENFDTELRRAFDVPDDQIPQKIGLVYREDTSEGILEGRLLLDPAAYRILRQRKLWIQHVQRLLAGLSMSLALLPPTVITVAWFPVLEASLETVLLLLVTLVGTWIILGRRITEVETFSENLWITVGLFCGGSTIVLTLYGLTAAAENLAALLAFAAAVGISSGFCAVLPAHAPRRLLYGIGLLTVVFLLFRADTAMLAAFVALVLVSTAFAVRWTLNRGLQRGRAIPVNTLWLVLLATAEGLVIGCGVFAGLMG